MPTPTPAFSLTLDHARRVIVAAQGLTGSGFAGLVPAIEDTGFVRTLGGVDVYLAARARRPGMSRAYASASTRPPPTLPDSSPATSATVAASASTPTIAYASASGSSAAWPLPEGPSGGHCYQNA